MPQPQANIHQQKQILFSAIFVLLWSTGFIVAKIGLRHAGPFSFIFIRLAIAVIIMAIVAVIMKARWPTTLKQFLHLSAAGILTHAVYLGASWSAVYQQVPVAIVAIIAGLQPLLTTVMAGRLLGEKTTQRQWVGLLVGFLGIFIIIEPRLQAALISVQGVGLALLALLGITFGTLYQKRFCQGIDLKAGQVVQLLASLLVVWPGISLFDEGPINWGWEFILALFWMSVVLSVVAIGLLSWLIYYGAASSVSVMFYITPPLATLYAYVILGENLGWLGIIGMAVTMSGLVLVFSKKH